MQGYVKCILEEKGFGFISGNDGRDVFFHCRELSYELEFTQQLVQRRVEYDLTTDPRSGRPRAKFVRAAD